jgi:hypothetical protein
MLWADTTAGIMKMRNGANSAWISLWELDGTFIATDISLSAGTAGAPSLYFTGDTNTGLFSPGADTVALATAGSNRLHITSAGLVGIGTTSPLKELQINATTPTIRLEENGGGSKRLEISIDSSALARIDATQSGSQLLFGTVGSERARIDSSGRLLVGTSTSLENNAKIQVQNGHVHLYENNDAAGACYEVQWSSNGGATGRLVASMRGVQETTGASGGRLVFSTTADGASSPTERMRIDNAGNMYVGTTNLSPAESNVVGAVIRPAGFASDFTGEGGSAIRVNRKNNDGNVVSIRQDGTEEGTISVSGTTVSYNGAHLSRWSQLPGGAEREEILRGTVLSNIDEMCAWGEEDNEQLNRMKVSDVEGDKNVSGVFQAWDDDDDTYTDDFYCAMTGDFIIRIAEGVTVERGDLLMSAGDGTAKPQGDGYVQDKTIAKVTSTNVSCTYEDGSYCVPCVLMAC